MEYSLQNLNQSSILTDIPLKKIIEDLNLIGFEVDNVFEEPFQINSYYNNIRFLLKIPANREDLLTEDLFLKELNRLFKFKPYENWKNLQTIYASVLKEQYLKYKLLPIHRIKSTIDNTIVYNIEIENFNDFISPNWLQEKIKNFGKRPTGTISDIAELINIEWGNSLISYPNTIINNEYKFEVLENNTVFINEFGKEILIPKNMIVVKDQKNIIRSIISYPTLSSKFENNKLVFQSIYYDIHFNSLNLNTLNTNLSLRYLRKNFLENFRFSLQRFLTLLKVLIKNKHFSIKIHKHNSIKKTLKLTKILELKKISSLQFLNALKYNEEIFLKAGLNLIGYTPKDLYFEVPNIRKDLNREIDLIEEYSRFIGYKNFNEILPSKNKFSTKLKNKSYKFIQDFFINLGFNEVIHSSINENKKEKTYSVLLANPLNMDFFLLRDELSSNLIETFQNNMRLGFPNPNSFEIGRIFKKINNKFIEEDRFCAIFTPLFGKNELVFSKDWYITKGFVESFLSFFNYSNVSFDFVKTNNLNYHPTRSFLIKNNNRIIGIFGEINPFKSNFKNSVYLFELNLSEFKDKNLKHSTVLIEELSKYPSIIKDLSITINKETNFEKLISYIKNSVTNLKKFYIFDLYFNNLGNNTINIGIRFEFQSETSTLTTLEIENKLIDIKQNLIEKFKVQIL